MVDVAAKNILRAWMGLSVLALALAGVMAILVAASRIPGIQDTFPWPVAFFQRGLVGHVVFSFVIWFLAAFGVLLRLAAPAGTGAKAGAADRLAPLLAAIAFVFLLIPLMSSRGEPTLNNYIPAVTDPLYYAGLVVLAAAAALAVARFLAPLGRASGREPLTVALAAGGMIFILAIGAFARAYGALAGEAFSFDFNETLFWGGGHILQFLNVSILIAAWIVLAEKIAGRAPGLWAWRPVLLLAAALPLAGALVGFAAELALDARAPERWTFFTQWQYALAPAPVLAVVALAPALRSRPKPGADDQRLAFLAFVFSVVVFAAGGALGLFVDGADTRTPAHYHGIIGGITLALMGVFLVVALPGAGRAPKPGRSLRVLIWFYGLGQLLSCIGLFWAGGYGTPRKIAGEAQNVTAGGAKAGLFLNGIGALIAVIGGVMFIWIVARALSRRPPDV